MFFWSRGIEGMLVAGDSIRFFAMLSIVFRFYGVFSQQLKSQLRHVNPWNSPLWKTSHVLYKNFVVVVF